MNFCLEWAIRKQPVMQDGDTFLAEVVLEKK